MKKLLGVVCLLTSTSAFAGRSATVLTCTGTDGDGGEIEAQVFYRAPKAGRADFLGFLVSNPNDPSERFFCFGGCVRFQRGVDDQQIVVSVSEPGPSGLSMAFDFDKSILTGGRDVFSEAVGRIGSRDGSRFISSVLGCTGAEAIDKLVGTGVSR